MNFTKEELAAIRHMIADLAVGCREDIAGTILYTGAFRLLKDGDGAVVTLARKLQKPNPKRAKYVGRKITRRQALKGLGNPKDWAKEEAKIDRDFRKKPQVGEKGK